MNNNNKFLNNKDQYLKNKRKEKKKLIQTIK